MSSVIAVIPARFAASRFPGKMLANRTGKPLIQHVIESVRKCRRIDDVIVATDEKRIFDAVESCGCQAVMTRSNHPNGTSRIAEVVAGLGTRASNLIVNVQGDEPEIEPCVIDELVDGLRADSEAPMATLASDFADDEDPTDPNIVKIVMDQKGRAMYFSRSLIPFNRSNRGLKPLKHPGLYAYHREFLMLYVALPETPLEQAEQLEQLRAIEHGYPIRVIKTTVRHHGIDTPPQYDDFVARHRTKPKRSG